MINETEPKYLFFFWLQRYIFTALNYWSNKMPTYEYRCQSCGNLFEYFQKITDQPVTVCESCGGELRKLISGGAAPIFKGSGFYQTDYKNNGNKEKKETKTVKKEEAKPAVTENK